MRYAAFISYSHADTRWAKWLHGRLEGFRLGDDLVGRETAMGRVPHSLRPVFRDRDEFAAGHSLTDQTRAALDDSMALIVVCSPSAAASHYVNEEIRAFKSRHADRLVIPLIVDDAPGHAQLQCFPPALAFAMAGDGTVTATPDAILAADIRKSGDGPDLALAKIVASLIGVPVDDVRKRQAIAQDWWIKVTAAVVAVVAVLALVAGFLVWEQGREQAQQAQQAQRLADIQALVEKLALAGHRQGAEAPGRKRAIAGAVEAADKGAQAGDPRLAGALDLLRQGRITDAEPLFRAVAKDKENASKAAGREAAEAWRHVGAIAGLADPGRSGEAYAHAAALDPDNIDGLSWHGWLQQQAGHLEGAEEAYRRLIALQAHGELGHEAYWARLGLGDIAVARGDLGAGKSSYIKAREIAERLAKADPDNSGRQRDLAVADEKIGDVLGSQGDLPEALTSFRDSLAIRARLAKTDPINAGWQRDLAVSYNKVGEVLAAQGHLPEALTFFSDSLAIADRLARADPGNGGRQRDLSVSYTKIGDVLADQGRLPEALTFFRDSLAIEDRLAKSDPDNAGWQRDLAIGNEHMGDIYARLGRSAEAIAAFEAALGVYRALLARNADDVQPRLLSVRPLWRLGELKGTAGRSDLEAALAILKPLAAADRLDAKRRGWIARIQDQIDGHDTQPVSP